MVVIRGNDVARIKSKYATDHNGCWIWQSHTNEHGYGRARFRGSLWLAHRISWTLFKGSIPEGMQVNHKCDARACINPEHLYIGSQIDNIKDMVTAGNSTAGEKSWSAKLTNQDVLSIRDSKLTTKQLADKYCMTTVNINAIKRRATWKHI